MCSLLLLALLAGPSLSADPHWKPGDAAMKDYNRGVEALEEGRLELAERRLHAALEADPGCGACAHALGLAMLRQDDAEEAVELLQELARTHPRRAEVMVSLADAAFGTQDFALSMEAAGVAIVLDATRWEALIAMQRVCLRTGDLATARRWMASAAGAHPDDRLACLEADLLVEESRLEAAAASLEKCARSGDEPLIAHVHSRLAAASGDFSELTSQAAASGDRELARLSEAFAAYDAGEYRRASSLLRRALEDQPDDAEAALLLGLSEHRDGHSDRAVLALARALEGEAWIRVRPDGSYAGVVTAGGAEVFEERLRQGLGLLVQLQVERGELAEAEGSYERAKQHVGACVELDAARIALLAARGEAGAASITATRALERGPPAPMLADAVRELLLRWPEARTPELLAAAAGARLAEGGYWAAVHHAEAGDASSCLSTLSETVSWADEPARPALTQLGYACAVQAEDLERAEAYRLLLRDLELTPDSDVSLNHARLLLAAERHTSCLRLLVGHAPSGPEAEVYARTLRLMAQLGLGEIDRALAIALEGHTAAEARLELAIALLREERLGEAGPLLATSCPELRGDHGERCVSLLDELQRVLGQTR
jgi:tetratricopeptide (TPR) repeat protein